MAGQISSSNQMGEENSNTEDRLRDKLAKERERTQVTEIPRAELEDRYLRLLEENSILKRHARKQEDRIKRMGTKILLFTNSQKRLQALGGTTPGTFNDADAGDPVGGAQASATIGGSATGAGGHFGGGARAGRKARDLESEEAMAELHNRVAELEKQNKSLNDKLSLARQQLITQGTKRTVSEQYDAVQSRIDTNILKSQPPAKASKTRTITEDVRQRSPPPNPNRYGQSVLDDVRAENLHLREVIEKANQQIGIYEQDIEILKERVRTQQVEHDEDIVHLKQNSNAEQKIAIQENIDFIRVQRDLREKTARLNALTAQYQGLEEKMRALTSAHEQLIAENDRLQDQVTAKDTSLLQLQAELRNLPNLKRELSMMREQTDDAKREVSALKEANENLLANAFEMEREREWRAKEQALRVQIAQLEATLKAEYGERGSVLDRLNEEKERNDQLEEELKKSRIRLATIEEDHDSLKTRMSFFSKDSAINLNEIEEALVLVKERKQRDLSAGDRGLEFLHRVDDETQRDVSKAYRELQAEHADTIQELEKTRNMLVLQYKINRDYQLEMEAVTKKMEENKREFETKLHEYAQLLDIRAARIKKLEAQMRDVAYGTKQYKATALDVPRELDALGVTEIDESVRLERGENILELNITRIALSEEAVRLLGGDMEPALFCTWDFYDFETQATPILKGIRNDYNFSSLYTVKVDDFFLQYLQRDFVVLEVHLAFGVEYRTVAVARLSLKDLFEKPSSRLHLNAPLTSTEAFGQTPALPLPSQQGVQSPTQAPGANLATVGSAGAVGGVASGVLAVVGGGVNFGIVEYWVHLKIPMDQALRLYRERTKALGYLSSNVRGDTQAAEGADAVATAGAAARVDESINNLHVKVVRATGVQARRAGMQPSPFVIYKFFDFPDHDTSIIPSSNNPEFNDHRIFSVQMFVDLDRYLKTQHLNVYLFDDTDPEEANYLGLARVPLIPLAHDNAIQGTFELRRQDGSINGTVELSFQWQFAYIPPRASTRLPNQPVPGGAGLSGAEAEPSVALLAGETLPLTSGPTHTLPFKAQTLADIAQKDPRQSFDRQVSMRPPEQPLKSALKHTEVKPGPAPAAVPVTAPAPVPVPTAQVPFSVPTIQATPPTPQPLPAQPPMFTPTSPQAQARSAPIPATIAGAALQASIAAATSGISASPSSVPLITSASSMPSTTSANTTPIASPLAASKEERVKRSLQSPIQPVPPPQLRSPEEPGSMSDTEDIRFGGPVSASALSQASGVSGPQAAQAGPGQPEQAAEPDSDRFEIEVHSLSFPPNSPVLANQEIKKIFLECSLLNIRSEMQFSLPKPSEPNQEMFFNWKEGYPVDFDSNYERRQYLAAALIAKPTEEIQFVNISVVSEPEELSGECNDVGQARFDIQQVFKDQKDLILHKIPVYGTESGSDRVIGTLCISIKCLSALRAVAQELPQASLPTNR